MRKLLFWSFAFCLTIGLSPAIGQDKDEAKKDLDKMQGTWRVVSWQLADEKKKTEDELKKMQVTVKGNTLI